MKKLLLVFVALMVSCSSINKKELPQETAQKDSNQESADSSKRAGVTEEQQFYEVGFSSWYGDQFQNKPTASGELFDKNKLTAAHRTLPMGTEVKVLNMENQKETIVRINDRGPFHKSRIIDVSEKAAEVLDFKEAGVTRVGLTLLNQEKVMPVKDDDAFFIDDEEDEEDEFDDEDIIPIVPPKSEEKPKNNVSPTPNPTPVKTEKKPSTNPTPANHGSDSSSEIKPKGYTVQIGVFKDKRKAENFRNSLKGSFSDTIYMFNRSGLYVVQIGDFNSRDQAVSLRTSLKAKGVFGFIPPK
ncbi:MAG: septal ring lytic transglycosylase RlpA family protein [Leptospiraceae bacterium]|nr:septal ring lytic transglycosylase RlpA family protein [Leptospiraceae bacterium]MCP5510509.1 septal ring lytic transglycosylase RlpA family protein [Leptospiraceae bacterium]